MKDKSMKAPAKYPKFLRCNATAEARSWNKYFLKPYAVGEVVKIAPLDEQHSTIKGQTDEFFRERFVKIYRKDEDNNYTLPYVAEWTLFELLTTPIAKPKRYCS